MTKENSIEVEKKYVIDSADRLLFEEIRTGFETEALLKNYKKGAAKIAVHTDDYYDTDGGDLYRQNIILRIRSKNDHKCITIKKDIEDGASGYDGQLARFEYEQETVSEDISHHWEMLKTYCGDLTEKFRPQDFHKVIRIEKNREKMLFTKDEFCFEAAFDSVTYINLRNGISKKEYQIEIELKSDYSHRDSLKIVTDELESKYQSLKPNTDSKYKRAVDMTTP